MSSQFEWRTCALYGRLSGKILPCKGRRLDVGHTRSLIGEANDDDDYEGAYGVCLPFSMHVRSLLGAYHESMEEAKGEPTCALHKTCRVVLCNV